MSEDERTNLPQAIECLLFASPDTLPPRRLAEILEVEPEQVDAAVEVLNVRLEGRGLQVVQLAGGYQLGTRPEYVTYVHRLLQPPPARLSAQALEVLAIVAYRQPVTRPEVDDIRGVNSQHSVATLAEKGLITTIGRKEAPGRPVLYGTTPHFLSTFGLRDLQDLPNMEAFQAAVVHESRSVLHGVSQTGGHTGEALEAADLGEERVDDPSPAEDAQPDQDQPERDAPAEEGTEPTTPDETHQDHEDS